MSDLFAPYHALTPPGRLVAMACGVIYPHSLTPAQLAKVLTRARFRHGHDPIRDNQYRASCDDLIAAGIIHDAGFRGKLIATGYWASLRDLLVKAIRFGEQPEIRAHLTTVVGQALDRDRLRGLMHDHALVQDAMDTSRLHAVREEMERADARRLQPHFIESFFLEAFKHLGGATRQRERGLGFEPIDREFEKLGYDVESRVPETGKLRFIEVKGRVEGAPRITVTRNEILFSLNKPDDFVLAIVEFSGRRGAPSSLPAAAVPAEAGFWGDERQLPLRGLAGAGGGAVVRAPDVEALALLERDMEAAEAPWTPGTGVWGEG